MSWRNLAKVVGGAAIMGLLQYFGLSPVPQPPAGPGSQPALTEPVAP